MVTIIASTIRSQCHLPWRLRRKLRRLGDHPRALAASSGVKEWSDRELARLQPSWVTDFLRRHVTRCAVLVCLYLFALVFLGASFERYWHWLQTTESVAGEPVKKVDRWTAHCRVNPGTRACRTVSRPVRGVVTLVSTSGAGVALSPGDGESDEEIEEPFEVAASMSGSL
jgi:hypothetical protein